ncbi:MAPEG family protein [Aureimonas leprariae]|uniref:MAPEG family protein n=1 Tax=Plantimonas leprariae TaxID=2615207 RepID=A0A7V7PLX7_9HYPH|nr:MAPEG family protein [Aureimonas leprariae]KAB0677597.1 hypothetical protein F6X38_18165 [Aureimonas leprariae]
MPPSPLTSLPIELALLAWSVPLLFLHIALQGVSVTRERGRAWNAGPRDGEAKPLGRFAGRADRALANFKETWPAFIVAVLAVVVAGRAGTWSAAGAWVWFLARIVYLPLYLFGVPYIRSLAYVVSVLGIFAVLFQLA